VKLKPSAISGKIIGPVPDSSFPAPWAYSSALIAAFSGVAYELLLANYATYLLGATIFQYSLVISLMMASMGVGALLMHRWRYPGLETFLGVEITLAVLAAVALPILYRVFAAGIDPRAVIGIFVVGMGVCIGMEIPLLNQMNQSKVWLPRILFFDYLGGFLGGVLFPLVLAPNLGLFRVAGLMSVCNSLLAVCVAWRFRGVLKGAHFWLAGTVLTLIATGAFLWQAETIRTLMELHLFQVRQ